MEFGSRLKAARVAKKLSQTELGRGLDTGGTDATKQTVSSWENGRHFPRVDQLVLICRKLTVSADQLLFGAVGAPVASEKVLAVAEAVEELSDEDRLQLFTRILGSSIPDEMVESRMPITKVSKQS